LRDKPPGTLDRLRAKAPYYLDKWGIDLETYHRRRKRLALILFIIGGLLFVIAGILWAYGKFTKQI
jgi:hypothetical protein